MDGGIVKLFSIAPSFLRQPREGSFPNDSDISVGSFPSKGRCSLAVLISVYVQCNYIRLAIAPSLSESIKLERS